MAEKQLQMLRCEGCGEFLDAGRRDKRFHGSSCRARFWRRRRDIELHSQLIQQYLAEWDDQNVLSIEGERVEREIVDIEKTIDGVLRSLRAYRAAASAIAQEKAERSQG